MSSAKPRTTKPQVSRGSAEDDVDDGIADVGDLAVDEQCYCNGDDDGAPSDACRTSCGDNRGDNQSHDSRADALEDAGECGIAFDGVGGEKHGNGQDDAERGQDGSQCGDNAATQPTQPVADDRGDVDGEDAGHGLCHGQEVEELVGWQPAVLVDNLTLDDADHGPSATEGEQANLEESYE